MPRKHVENKNSMETKAEEYLSNIELRFMALWRDLITSSCFDELGDNFDRAASNELAKQCLNSFSSHAFSDYLEFHQELSNHRNDTNTEIIFEQKNRQDELLINTYLAITQLVFLAECPEEMKEFLLEKSELFSTPEQAPGKFILQLHEKAQEWAADSQIDTPDVEDRIA